MTQNIYKYTKKDQLKFPQKYTYSKNQGVEFFNYYFSDRENILKKYKQVNKNIKKHYYKHNFKILADYLKKNQRQFYVHLNNRLNIDLNKIVIFRRENFNHFDDPKKEILNYMDSEKIRTSELLDLLTYMSCVNQTLLIRPYVDTLLQRFEVTKRLYEYYNKGLRNGSGNYNDVSFYWQFTIILSITYIHTNNLKYLNTVLKISDLILSLPLDHNIKFVSYSALQVAIGIEMKFIKNL